MQLSEIVKKELQERWLQQSLCLPHSIIPEEAHFAHVLPFFPRPDLNQQNIIEILKKDNNFYKPESMTESEVAIFAEILFRLINNIDGLYGDIDLYFKNDFDRGFGGCLSVRFPNAHNLADILAGNFTLSMTCGKPTPVPYFLLLLLFSSFSTYSVVQGWMMFCAADPKNSFFPVLVAVVSTLGSCVSLVTACMAARLIPVISDYYSEYNRTLVKFYEKYTNAVSAPIIVTPIEEVNSESTLLSP